MSSFFSRIKDNYLPIFLILFVVTPILVCFVNFFNLPNLLVWYIPNIIMIYYGLRCLIVKNNIINKRVYCYIYIYFIIMFISCLFSFNTFESFFGSLYRMEGFITYISFFGFFCFGVRVSCEKYNDFYVNILLIVSAVISILCIMRFPFVYSAFNISRNDYYFFVGPFFHFNHMGYYLLIVCFLSTFMFIFSDKKKCIFYYIIYFILTYTLIVNDTFGVFIAYSFVMIVSFVYLILKRRCVTRIFIVIISFAFICSISYRDEYNVVYRNFSGLFNDVEKINNGDVGEINSIGTDRGELWINGAKYVIKKPLLGYGLENTKYEYFAHNINQSKPHNIVLEQCLNTGIIGAFIYFSLICCLIINQLKNINYLSVEHFVCLCIVVGFLISSLFGNSTFYVSPYFYFILGFLMRNYKGRCKYEV